MKLAVLFSVLFAAALMAVIQIALAQVPGSLYEKAPRPVIEALTAGNPQDVIVVFDDKPTLKEAHALELATGHDSRHSRVIEFKAGRYADQKQKILSAFASHEAAELKHYSHLPVGFVRIHSKKALDRLLAHPGVVGVYKNTVERKALAESLPLIGQPQVAAQGSLGAGTTVAVLDTGVDYTKAAFGSCTAPGAPVNCKVVFAQDFAPSDGKLDDDGHGTNVAGIVLGVAPGTKIVALDVFHVDAITGEPAANGSDILNAINWVIANKAAYSIVAINLSLGSGQYNLSVTSGIYNSAVTQARAAGILTIAAAGNDAYTNAMSQPAAVVGVVSVGAIYDSAMGWFNWGSPLRCTDTTSASDKVVCFSNSASFLTLLAPGSQITAAGITQSGTSQAAPHVAGAVAVLRAAFPGETLDQTVARLTTGVMVTDSRNDITKPLLNLQMAMALSAPCTYGVSSASASYSAGNSSGSVSVTTAAACPWSAASSASSAGWISVISGSSDSGNGAVNYSVSANPNVTARSGTLTIAGQTFTITQSGSVGASANSLLNPDFEGGPVSWTESTAIEYPIITAYISPVANNGWYAWLCGYDNCVDTLYQDVTIPADATSAYLQFDYHIETDEASTVMVYDKMQVRVYSPPTASTYTYWTLSNLNATTGWALSPQYDVSAFKGQRVRLQFSATTDASLTSSFYLDNVNLTVSGSSPDVQAPTVPTGLVATAISGSAISLNWSASTDNRGVAAYKIYRDGALLATLGNVRAYSDTGLTASATYSYTVSACDAAGNCSALSAVATARTGSLDVQPPTVPTITYASTTFVGSIGIAWLAATDNVGVTSYKLYRNGVVAAVVGKVTSTADVGLSPGTNYSYTLAACDAAGNCSAQSLAVLGYSASPVKQYSPVTLVGSIASNPITANSINITIEQIDNSSSGHSGSLRIELWALTSQYLGGSVNGYVTASIRTSQISGLADYIGPYGAWSALNLTLPFTRPPATNNQYVLFLLEYSPTNCSTADNFCIIDYANLHEVQAPTVPNGLAGQAINSSQADFVWNAATDNVGVTNYKVYRNGVVVALLGNVTSYSDKGLTASTPYSYTVAACDAWQNCSAQSVAAVVTTPSGPDIQPPSVPTGLTATAVSSTQINLAWNASTDIVGVSAYKIYSSGGLVATLGNVMSSSRTTAPATTYSYTVSACDAAGNCSAHSVAATATTLAPSDTQAPTIPTGLTATAISSNAINLVWTAATDNVGVANYKLYRGGTLLATLGNLTRYGDSGLRDATAYNYTVAACDALSNCSAQSIATTATTQGAVGSTLNLVPGWNLVGNSVNVPGSVSTTFGNATNVSTVWKWVATSSKWAFYSPALIDGGAAYASTKGYDSLVTINGGEGFWVNAKAAFTAQLPAGTSILSSNFQDQSTLPNRLPTGWSLIAVGDNPSPRAFSNGIALTPPAGTLAATSLTTLWAWDSVFGNWYFYAPSLDNAGTLQSYIASKGYLDFMSTGKTLAPGAGFWVNKP